MTQTWTLLPSQQTQSIQELSAHTFIPKYTVCVIYFQPIAHYLSFCFSCFVILCSPVHVVCSLPDPHLLLDYVSILFATVRDSVPVICPSVFSSQSDVQEVNINKINRTSRNSVVFEALYNSWHFFSFSHSVPSKNPEVNIMHANVFFFCTICLL